MEDKKDEHKQQGELYMWDSIDQVGRSLPHPSDPAGARRAVSKFTFLFCTLSVTLKQFCGHRNRHSHPCCVLHPLPPTGPPSVAMAEPPSEELAVCTPVSRRQASFPSHSFANAVFPG